MAEQQTEIEQIIVKQLSYLKTSLLKPCLKKHKENYLQLKKLEDLIYILIQYLSENPSLSDDSEVRSVINYLKKIEKQALVCSEYDGFSVWRYFENQLEVDQSSWVDEIVYTQSEERFISQESDSIYIKLGKQFKRINRSFAKTENSIKNKWLVYRKSEPIDYIEETQKVLVPLIWSEVLYSVFPEIEEDKAANYSIIIKQTFELLHQITLFVEKKAENVDGTVEKLKGKLVSITELIDAEIASASEFQKQVIAQVENSLKKNYALNGTFEFTHKTLAKKTNQKEYAKKIDEELALRQEKWLKEWTVDINFLGLFREVLELQIEHNTILDNLFTQLNDQFKANYKRVLESIAEILKASEVENKSDKVKKFKPLELKEHLQHQLEELRAKINLILAENRKLKSLDKKDEIVQDYETKFDDSFLVLSERATVFTDYSNKESKADSDFKSIEWQVLLKRIIISEHLHKTKLLTAFFDETSIETENLLQSVTEVMETNIVSAIAKTKDDHLSDLSEDQTILDIVGSAYNRSINQLISYSSSKEEELSEIKKDVNDSLINATQNIISQIVANELGDLESKRRNIQVKSRAVDWKMQLEITWARVEDFTIRFSKATIKYVRFWWQKINDLLYPSVKVVTKKSQEQLGDYLIELYKTFERLPFVYKKLFDLEGINELRFYYKRENSIMEFNSAYQNWLNGSGQTLSVIGEKGSGRSFFVNKIIHEKSDFCPVTFIKTDKTIYNESGLLALLNASLGSHATSTDELITFLSKKEKSCIVIDSLERLFLRSVDGFEAVEQLLLLINSTSANIFWVVISGRYNWTYLDKILKLSMNFSSELEMDKLSGSQIKEILLKRHKLSGFQIRFEPDSQIKQMRAYKKLQGNEPERQQFLENLFFAAINEVSQGNLRIAMIQWLRSIKKVDELVIEIRVIEDMNIQLPMMLQDSEYFSLSNLVLHSKLSAAHHSKIFNESLVDSKLILSRLEMMNLIELDDEGMYQINVFAFRPVITALKRKNILH
jgi:hypothetical protein